MEQHLAPDVEVSADPVLLGQALQTLSSNALNYHQDGGRIRFELAAENGRVFVRVANTGLMPFRNGAHANSLAGQP